MTDYYEKGGPIHMLYKLNQMENRQRDKLSICMSI